MERSNSLPSIRTEKRPPLFLGDLPLDDQRRPLLPKMADRATSEAFYHTLIDHLQDAVALTRHGHLLFVNQAFAALLGYASVAEVLGRPITDVIAPEDRALVLDMHRRRLAGELVSERYRFHMLAADGKRRVPVTISVGTIKMSDGTVGTVGTIKDMSSEDDLYAKLATSEAELRLILHNMPDIFYRTDDRGIITMINPAIAELGYTPEEIIGRPMIDLYVNPGQREDLLKTIREAGSAGARLEVEMRHHDGHSVWVETRAFIRIAPDGTFLGTEGIARDVTERRAMEQQLRHLAGHDPLTDLPNRSLMRAHLDLALARAKRRNEGVGLMFIDLNDFKPINDIHGHEAGDRALQTVARRLRRCVRETDTVARLGGDEFTIIVEDEATAERVQNVADRIMGELTRPLMSAPNGQPVHVSASIGIALFPHHAQTPDALLVAADTAMYAAKRAKRGSVQTYAPLSHSG